MRGQDLLQKTSRAMSSKFNIRLIATGSEAKTDGKTIQVPSLPETLTQTEWEVLCGYSEHEVAHVRFSDFECIKHITDQRVMNLANLLEDVRIEKIHGDEFAGVRALLEKTMFHIWNKYYVSDLKNVNIGAMLLFEARKQCANFKLSAVPSYEKECKSAFGEKIFERISALKSSQDAITLAKELLEELEEDLTPPPPAPPTPSDDKQDGDEGKGKGKGKGEAEDKPDDEEDAGDESDEDSPSDEDDEDEDDGSDKGKGEGEESDDDGDTDKDEDKDSDGKDKDESEDGDSDDGDKDESEDDGDSDGDGDESSDEPGDDSEGGEGSDGEGGDGDEDSSSDGAGGSGEDEIDESDGLAKEIDSAAPSGEPNVDDGEDKAPRPVKEILEAIDNGDMDVAEMLRSDLVEIHKTAMESRDYLVLSREFDKIETIEDKPTYGRPEKFMEEFDRLKSEIVGFGPARSKLSGMFLARILNRWIGDKDEGRINPRSLSKLRCGYKSVFREKTKSDDLNTAITFLVDYSGSMARSNINEAMKTVILFLDTLTQSKIKCEVLGYTTGPWTRSLTKLHDSEARLGRSKSYGRVDPLLTYVIKSFDEMYDNKVKRRIGAHTEQRLSENCDGDSIMVAYHRISQRKEKRKILFVLSDGCVANNGNSSLGRAYLKKVCESIEKEGAVELIGIGFGCDEVKSYFKNSILYNSYGRDRTKDTLANVMYRELKKIFKV